MKFIQTIIPSGHTPINVLLKMKANNLDWKRSYILWFSPIKVEPKHRVRHKALVVHVVEDGGHLVHGNARERHPHDPIKLGVHKSVARLLYCFTKYLVFDCETSDLRDG